MNIFKTMQFRFKNANIVEQLIYVNLGVFITVFLVNTFSFLFGSNSNILLEWFSLPASFSDFTLKPWTLITYGFLHVGFIHILFNLIALFYIGNLFLEYFTTKQLLTFYVFGTAFGGLIYLISYNYFPAFSRDIDKSLLLGASAGISAIFVGIASYMPNYQLKIRFIGFVKLWYLAAIWVVFDLIQIPVSNAGGHLAHLGGALFGYLYVSQASNKKTTLWSQILSLFIIKKKPLKTAYKSGKKTVKSKESNLPNQKEINTILDKISKSGYDTLTKTEKEFLFKQGKK